MKHALHLSRVANRSGRNLLSWCLFLGMSLMVNTVFATETEPATKATKNKEEIPHKKSAESTPNLPVAPSNAKLINSQMQAALGQMNLSSRSTKQAVLVEQTAMLDSLEILRLKRQKVNKLITKADSTFKILQRLGQLLNFEKFSSGLKVQFPIGLHQDFSGENAGVDIGFMNLRMTHSVNYLTVFARMKLPIKNPRTGENYQDIFFGADSVKISHDGNILGDCKLVLLGDISVPFGKGVFTLKGGFDMATGEIPEGITYVRLDCNRFKEVSVAAELVFPRSLLLPIDYDGNVTQGYVTGKFAAVSESIQNLLGKIDLGSFAVKGFEKWGFRLNGAVMDFSETRNSSDVKFPVGYIEKAMPTGAAKAWKGVYIDKFEMILPKEFRKRGNSDRISFGADSLLIDENGVTGKFYGKNILKIKEGDANGWKMSLDYVRVGFEANACTGGRIDGRIVLPVTDVRDSLTYDPNTGRVIKFDTTGTLKYSGIIERGGKYKLSVITTSVLPFEFWKAKATLLPNSRVDLVVEDDVFKPTAVLHGSLDINYDEAISQAEKGGTAKKVDLKLKTITFRNFKLYTEAPYIEIEYMGYNGDIKLGGIPMTLSGLSVVTDQEGKAQIKLGSNVNLMKNNFNVDSEIRIKGKLNKNTVAGHQWEFDGIEVLVRGLDAKIGPFRLKGGIYPFENNPCMPSVNNNGINRGYESVLELTMDIPVKISVKANAIFGRTPDKEDGRFWFVDGAAEIPPVPLGAFALNSIAGGAYHHMVPIKSNETCPASKTGRKFVYNDNVELGFKATAGFSTVGTNAISGMLGFEIVINRNYGVNSLGFFGEATVSGDFPFLKGKLIQGVSDKVQALNKKVSQLSSKLGDAGTVGQLANELSQSDLQNKANSEYAKADNVQEAKDNAEQKNLLKNQIRARVGILFDFENATLHADASIHLSIGGGVIRGRGAEDKAGWIALHFQKKQGNQEGKWYIHVGSPSDPCGVRMGIGPFSINTGLYLMIGYEIPPMPEPPAILREMLGRSYVPLARPACTKDGSGFSFGANVNVDTGDMQILIFYARVQAGIGFDFALTDAYKGTLYNGKQMGINGWYGTGQAYAYFDAAVGIKIKIWFVKVQVEIFRAGAGVLLQGGLPNPSFLDGYLAARYRALGGVVSGSFSLKVGIGDKPTSVDKSGDCKTKKI